MYSHRTTQGRVMFLDSENQLFLMENSAGDGAGFLIQVLHTEKLMFNDGSVASKSPFLLALANNKDIDKSGVVESFDTYSEITRLIDLKLKVIGAASATTVVADVMAECDATPIAGLVTADFKLLTAAGGPQVVTAVEDPGDPGPLYIDRHGPGYRNIGHRCRRRVNRAGL